LINDANAAGKIIGVVAQKDESDEDPTKTISTIP
jgi:ATP-dependent Lon protease